MSKLHKTKLAMLIAGSAFALEVIMILVLAITKTPIPEQVWALIYATLGLMSGVLGAQAINGKLKES